MMKTLVIVAHPDIEKSKLIKDGLKNLRNIRMKLRCMVV